MCVLWLNYFSILPELSKIGRVREKFWGLDFIIVIIIMIITISWGKYKQRAKQSSFHKTEACSEQGRDQQAKVTGFQPPF